MKNSFKLHEVQENRKKKEDDLSGWVVAKECVVCNKTLPAPYARHMVNDEEKWVCNSKCEGEFNAALHLRSHGETAS